MGGRARVFALKIKLLRISHKIEKTLNFLSKARRVLWEER